MEQSKVKTYKVRYLVNDKKGREYYKTIKVRSVKWGQDIDFAEVVKKHHGEDEDIIFNQIMSYQII